MIATLTSLGIKMELVRVTDSPVGIEDVKSVELLIPAKITQLSRF